MIKLKKVKVSNPSLFLRIIRLTDINKISVAEAQELAYHASLLLSRNNTDVNKAIFQYYNGRTEKFISYTENLVDLNLAMLYEFDPDLNKIYDHYLQEILSIFEDLSDAFSYSDDETVTILSLAMLVKFNFIELFEVIDMVSNIRELGHDKETCIFNLRRNRLANILKDLKY